MKLCSVTFVLYGIGNTDYVHQAQSLDNLKRALAENAHQ